MTLNLLFPFAFLLLPLTRGLITHTKPWIILTTKGEKNWPVSVTVANAEFWRFADTNVLLLVARKSWNSPSAPFSLPSFCPFALLLPPSFGGVGNSLISQISDCRPAWSRVRWNDGSWKTLKMARERVTDSRFRACDLHVVEKKVGVYTHFRKLLRSNLGPLETIQWSGRMYIHPRNCAGTDRYPSPCIPAGRVSTIED